MQPSYCERGSFTTSVEESSGLFGDFSVFEELSWGCGSAGGGVEHGEVEGTMELIMV